MQEAARASGNAGFRAIVAHALLEAGEDRAARDTLGAPPHPDERNYATRAAHCLRLAVLAAGGNRDEIAGAMGPVAAYSGELVAFGSVDALGAVDYFIALGSAALGDSEAARRQVVAALKLDQTVGNVAWAQRAEELATRLER